MTLYSNHTIHVDVHANTKKVGVQNGISNGREE